jgi:hypothetical protein
MERSWESKENQMRIVVKKKPILEGSQPKLKPDPITPWNGQRLDAIIPPGVCFPIHIS